MLIEQEPSFSFLNTVKGHGWFQLAPFEFDEAVNILKFTADFNGAVCEIAVTGNSESLRISVTGGKGADKSSLKKCVRRVFRIDEPFSEFHEKLRTDKDYDWIVREKRGPLMRSPTVFEDLVKTICTTNCSWALTKIMVSNLVDKLGADSESGTKAFPVPAMIAGVSEEFMSNEIRSGYRGPYLLELANEIVSGRVDPESWLDSELTSVDLKKEIKAIKGVGDYAAEHMLKLLGRYDGLALDSFLRSEFYKHHNKGKKCPDRHIEKHYARFGKWKGLVIWFDMVKKRSESGK